MPGAQTLYKRHRQWALGLAAERGGSDEDRLTALLALAKACRNYHGNEFRRDCEMEIRAALQRKAVPA